MVRELKVLMNTELVKHPSPLDILKMIKLAILLFTSFIKL